jgi:hypothetical protein
MAKDALLRGAWKLALFVAALAFVAAAPAAADTGDGAHVFQQQATFEIPVDDVNPCTGEPFTGEATVHVVTTVTSTPSSSRPSGPPGPSTSARGSVRWR